jgi:hypothetical protein
MTIPEHVNAQWISTLGDAQLVRAEASLHTTFRKHEKVEKARCGARYVLLQGPPDLVNAWLRWLLVSNATRTRGLVINHAVRRH